MNQKYFTHTLVGRPFFWKELPKDTICTRFQYQPDGFRLTIWYTYEKEFPKRDFEFEVFRPGWTARTAGMNYLGDFNHNSNLWSLYYKPL